LARKMNKLEKFAEMDKLPNVIQADFSEVFRTDYKLKGRWSAEFFGNTNPVVLELGCGRGEYTVALARKYPDKNFIGVDIKGARMYNGASTAYKEGLRNAAFIRSRIEMIGSFFAPSEIDEIWLTFPDPQMQKTRKRLTACRFLELYARFLKPGGIIHLKTDSNFMYTYTRELVLHNGLTMITDQSDLYNSGFEDEILSVRTYYEERFLGQGMAIKYLSFRLDNKNTLVEPQVDIPRDNYRNTGRRVAFDDQQG
jgi:tRNA (guanine-N7-)-methyltransferase